MRFILLIFAIILAGGHSAWATGKQRTDINMVVAFDRSESIDRDERQGQIDALVHALSHQRFLNAVTSGYHGKIGLSVIAWSSFDRTEVILPWIEIGGRADTEEAIRRIHWHHSKDADVSHGKQTDIALAIATATDLLDRTPFFGSRQVINVISDGIDNFGRLAGVDRDIAIDKGITINGLVQARGSAVEVISRFFRRQVVGGPGSFVQAAAAHEDFAKAMVRKMVLEIAFLNQRTQSDGT